MNAEMIPREAVAEVLEQLALERGGIGQLAVELESPTWDDPGRMLRRIVEPAGSQRLVSFDLVDRILTGAGEVHRWYQRPLVAWLPDGYQAGLTCEDCALPIAPGEYRPLDLMRWDPAAEPGKRARPGGRRWRVWHLCRGCAATALQQRAHSGTNVSVGNGRKRYLRGSERVAPRRGGRPRLLSDEQLRAAHVLYRGGMTLDEITNGLLAAGRAGTRSGLFSALRLGFIRLGLPIRAAGDSVRLRGTRKGHGSYPDDELTTYSTIQPVLRAWRDAGTRWAELVSATGVSESQLRAYLNGPPSGRLRKATAQRIVDSLAIEAEKLAA